MLVGNRFKTEAVVGQGSFSSVYRGTDLETSKPVAIKICPKQFKSFVKLEAGILSTLSDQKGFPKFLSSGEFNQNVYIAMSLLGPSLFSRLSVDLNPSLTICRVGRQMVTSLELLHKSCYIHRDLKPENIVTGMKHSDRYYLIDFGLATKFWDKRNNFHNPMKSDCKFKGNLIFCSNNVLSGIEASRRDDFVSLCFILMFMAKKGLPWVHHIQTVEEMIGFRSSVSHQDLLKGVPLELQEVYNYVISLSFYQAPDYKYLLNVFKRFRSSLTIGFSEVVKSRKNNKKREKTVATKSKTQFAEEEVFLGSCPTIKIEAPDFSHDLIKKINLLRQARLSDFT